MNYQIIVPFPRLIFPRDVLETLWVRARPGWFFYLARKYLPVPEKAAQNSNGSLGPERTKIYIIITKKSLDKINKSGKLDHSRTRLLVKTSRGIWKGLQLPVIKLNHQKELYTNKYYIFNYFLTCNKNKMANLKNINVFKKIYII